MTAFTVERTARKPHKCDRCLGQIRPGEQYTAYSIPPGSDLDNNGWISGHEHASPDCARWADEPEPPDDWPSAPGYENAHLPPDPDAAALDRVRALAGKWAALPGDGLSAALDRRIGQALLDVTDKDPRPAEERLERLRELAERWMTPGATLFYPVAGQCVLDAIGDRNG